MNEWPVKIGMLTLLGATTPIGAEIDVWAQWGLAGMVVMYTLWRDYHREKRLALSIEHQQRWLRDTLIEALNKNTEALNKVIELYDDHYDETEE